MLALDYSLDEMNDILSELEFRSFMDSEWGLLRDSGRLVKHFGWYKGDFFRSWMGELIRKKTGEKDATFRYLKEHSFLDLYLIGTNLSTEYSEIFSAEHTPDKPVVDAVRISMSIPLFFAAVRNDREDVYVDGGVMDNYPVKLFDSAKYVDNPRHMRETEYYAQANAARSAAVEYVYNKETLGFRLDSGREIALFRDGIPPCRNNIGDFFDYAKCLVGTIMNLQNNQHLHSDDWHRTIYIDTLGVRTTDFDISDEKKKALIAGGKACTEKYFEWFDRLDPKDPPVNHPDSAG